MGKNPTICRIRCSHDTLQMLWQKHPSDSYGLFLPWHHLKPLGPRQLCQKKNEFTKMWMARDVKVRNNPCITIAQLLQKKYLKTSDVCSTKSVGCFRWSWASTQDKIQVRYLGSQSSNTTDLSEASCHRLDAVWIGEAPNHLKPKAFLRGL